MKKNNFRKVSRKKKLKKGFDIKREYSESWDYLKNSKNYIFAVILIFFLFALIGFFIPAPDVISEKILEYIMELLEKTKGMSQLELTKYIFLNNLKSSFFGIVFGVLFGIFPVLGAIVNGYVLGFVGIGAVNSNGILVLFRLFPHGIFELPAIFISFGLGLKLGIFVFSKNRRKTFVDYFLNSMKVFLYIVIPLLIFAAIIEGLFIFLP
ncbi:MAG: stage II sporulation protein M [archaeon]